MTALRRLLVRLSGVATLPWGGYCMAALFWCLASGVLAALFYDPGLALDSTRALQFAWPGGFLLRGVHAWSADLLLVTLALHTMTRTAARSYERMPRSRWMLLGTLLLLLPLASLTGFIVRGDAAGAAALQVLVGLANTLPLVGADVAALFAGTGPERALAAPYAWHVGLLSFATLLIAGSHARRLLPRARPAAVSLALLAMLAALFPRALGPAPGTPLVSLDGPWYFAPLQQALAALPPAVAGLLLPVLFGALLMALPWLPSRAGRLARIALALGAWAYAVFGLVASRLGG